MFCCNWRPQKHYMKRFLEVRIFSALLVRSIITHCYNLKRCRRASWFSRLEHGGIEAFLVCLADVVDVKVTSELDESMLPWSLQARLMTWLVPNDEQIMYVCARAACRAPRLHLEEVEAITHLRGCSVLWDRQRMPPHLSALCAAPRSPRDLSSLLSAKTHFLPVGCS
jgi:hypothetical protein